MSLHTQELTIDDEVFVKELAIHLKGHPMHGDPVVDYVEFSKWIANSNFLAYGTFDDTHLVGKIIVENIPSIHTIILKGLRVHADYRRQGIGFDLLQYAIHRSSKQEVDTLICYVSSSNLASLNLTKKCGFIESMNSFCLGSHNPFPIPSNHFSEEYQVTEFTETEFLNLVRENPDFFEGKYYPDIWDFLPISAESIKRLYKRNTVRSVKNNEGEVQCVFSQADVIYYLQGKPEKTRSVVVHSLSLKGMQIALDVVLRDLRESDNQYIGIRTSQRTLPLLRDRFKGSEHIDQFDMIVLNKDVDNV